jgi:copper oxidase (laccase) domain-containing protein
VHGAGVAVVERPGDRCGEQADAAVTACSSAALMVRTADCAPVALGSPEGVVAIVHAGWRGLLAGVVEAALAAMESLGARSVSAAVGPCIQPHAYPFSVTDLEKIAARLGGSVVSSDAAGRPALDLPGAVVRALEAAGAHVVARSRTCTHCSGEHWSWRARGDRSRQATFVWKEP